MSLLLLIRVLQITVQKNGEAFAGSDISSIIGQVWGVAGLFRNNYFDCL